MATKQKTSNKPEPRLELREGGQFVIVQGSTETPAGTDEAAAQKQMQKLSKGGK